MHTVVFGLLTHQLLDQNCPRVRRCVACLSIYGIDRSLLPPVALIRDITDMDTVPLAEEQKWAHFPADLQVIIAHVRLFHCFQILFYNSFY